MKLPSGTGSLSGPGSTLQTGRHSAARFGLRVPNPLHRVLSVASLPGDLARAIARGGYLESRTLAESLAGIAGVVVAAWVAAAIRAKQRHRRMSGIPRWLANAGLSVVVFLLVVASGAVAINGYVGYLPSLSALLGNPAHSSLDEIETHDPSTSQVVEVNIPSRRDGISSGPAYVYLPPGYNAPANRDRRYPVIYLIHGLPGRPQDWVNAGQIQQTMNLLIAAHDVGPMIVVAPTASTGYFADDECLNVPGGIQIENYLAFTVVDRIDHLFRALPGRNERVLGGMSSGAFCALNVGLHHLHRFSVILASEPFGTPGPRPLHNLLSDNQAVYRANSPFFYIPFWRFAPPVAVFLDSGSRDPTTTRNAQQLADELADRGQVVAYRQAPGQHHTWKEVRVELPYSLIFAWHELGRLPDGGSNRSDERQFLRAQRLAVTAPAVGGSSPQAVGAN